jgi:nucleotide-binding universal stress UspA family protein
MYQIHRILIPTDFSPHSVYAFGVGRDLARQNAAEVLLLHVAGPPGPEQVSFGEMHTQLEPESYYRRLLEDMRRQFPPSGKEVPLQYLISEGEPVAEILRVAREKGCDLIVVGTYGHNPLRRLLMGSTAERLVRAAPCPVLTVKLPASAEPETTRPEAVQLQSLSR